MMTVFGVVPGVEVTKIMWRTSLLAA